MPSVTSYTPGRLLRLGRHTLIDTDQRQILNPNFPASQVRVGSFLANAPGTEAFTVLPASSGCEYLFRFTPFRNGVLTNREQSHSTIGGTTKVVPVQAHITL